MLSRQPQQNTQKYFLPICNNYLYDTAASVKMQQNILNMKKRQPHHQRYAYHNKKVNLPVCHGRSQARGNVRSHHSAQAVHTPRACCTAASPFCPLCRGVAVLVLDGNAVKGKDGAILKPGFHPVGVHVVAAGKQFVHKAPLLYVFIVWIQLVVSLLVRILGNQVHHELLWHSPFLLYVLFILLYSYLCFSSTIKVCRSQKPSAGLPFSNPLDANKHPPAELWFFLCGHIPLFLTMRQTHKIDIISCQRIIG